MLTVDAQSWWTPSSGPHDGETMHVHVGGTWPLYERLTGQVPIDLSVKLHHADGYVQDIECPLTQNPPKGNYLQGDPDSSLVQKTFPFTMDTTRRATDGWTLFQAQVSFVDGTDGSRRAARIRGSVYTRNGYPPNDEIDPKELTALSWFQPSDTDGRGYTNAAIALRSLPIDLDGRMTPVAGIWRPLVRVHPSISGQMRHLFVTVDPDFHNPDPDLREGSVVLREPNATSKFREVSIDTSRLSKGPHRLMVKGSDEGMFPRGTLQGALVIGFTVA